MKDKKERSDLGHRLSEMCVKIALASLAFSAAAFALGDRIREVPEFDAFGKFELARDILSAQIADLEEDPCWKLYLAALSDETAVSRTTLQELSQVKCSDQAPNIVKVGSKRMIAGTSHGPVADFRGTSLATSNITASHLASSKPSLSKTNFSVTSAVPDALGVEDWLPLPETEAISKTVKILWDEPTLASAQRYSRVAGEEVYRWRLHRARLFKQRVDASELKSSRPPTEAGFDVSKLQIEDLREIAKSSHTSLVEIDRVVHDQFSAPLPDTSYGVNIGTASQIVAAILVLLAAALAAYVRAALNADAISTPGTVFHVLLGSSWGELVIHVVLCVPLAAVAYLDYSIEMQASAGVYLSACTIAIAIAVLSTIKRLFPRQS
jgi:hypothetical protein